jgi:hypothetical protein
VNECPKPPAPCASQNQLCFTCADEQINAIKLASRNLIIDNTRQLHDRCRSLNFILSISPATKPRAVRRQSISDDRSTDVLPVQIVDANKPSVCFFEPSSSHRNRLPITRSVMKALDFGPRGSFISGVETPFRRIRILPISIVPPSRTLVMVPNKTDGSVSAGKDTITAISSNQMRIRPSKLDRPQAMLSSFVCQELPHAHHLADFRHHHPVEGSSVYGSGIQSVRQMHRHSSRH